MSQWASSTNHIACLLGTSKDVPHSSGLSLIDVKVKLMVPLKKRRGVGPLCCPLPSWICVDTIIPCPGVVDKEGADTVCVHSSQTITFRMMITTSHFYCIEERSYVFIPLEFKHHKDTRPLCRTAFFSYLNGVWEWVQVTSDHMANHFLLWPTPMSLQKHHLKHIHKCQV